MAAPTITTRAQYEVLRLYAARKTDQQIADQLQMPRATVTPIIDSFTGGDYGIASGLVAAYESRARAVAAAQGKPGAPGLPRTTTVPPAPARTPAAAEPTPPDPLAELLAAAAASPARRTQQLGEKLRGLAEELRTALAQEQRAAAAQKRVDELQAELEAAREALRAANGRPATLPAARSTDPAGVPPKVVRAWARDNGVDVPAIGRIPRTVMDAYLNSQKKEG